MTIRGEQDHAVVGTVRADDAGHIACHLLPAAIGDLGGGSLGIQPAPLLGDAHRQHLILGAVDMIYEISHRNTADLMFAGHTAEQKDNTHGILSLHDNSLLFQKPRYGAESDR